MRRRDASPRRGGTASLTDLMGSERSRLYGEADGARRERMRAAERQRTVFGAWNEVCANTREGRHVTGLKYLPDSNELLVYAEAGPWATELSMMREVIRARMAAKGVEVSGIVCKTSRGGYAPAASRASSGLPGGQRPRGQREGRPHPHPPLSAEEEASLAAAVEPIRDASLREALRRAMGASLAWEREKGTEGEKKA